MKAITLITVLFFVSFQSIAQFNEDKALYFSKVEKYRKMKSTGQILTFTGTGLMVIGMVTLLNTSYTTTYNSYGQMQTSSDGNPGAGVAAYLVGAAAVGAGIPLWIVGGVNKGRYERKLSELSVNMNASPRTSGLRLSYRF